MDFRIRIKELCKARNITQKDLAAKLGVTDISLNKSLRGEYPQLQTLERIANALEVEVSELFEERKRGELKCPNCGVELNVKIE